jgi:hypothetical protein
MNCLKDCATTQLAVSTVEKVHGPDHRDVRTIELWACRCEDGQSIDQRRMITSYRTSW